VLWTVAPAVAAAASAEGLARLPLQDAGAYAEQLRTRFQASHGLLNTATAAARTQPMKVVYPHGDDIRLLRASRRVLDEGIGSPVLLGNVEVIEKIADGVGIDLTGIELIDPSAETETLAHYARRLFELRQAKGMTIERAQKEVIDHNMFAALRVREGAADAVLGGLTTFYPATIRPALQVLPMEPGRSIVSSLYVVIIRGTPYFFTDCAVNIEPSSDQLVEIASAAVDIAREQFNRESRVAFISYSDFGSAAGAEPERVRTAVERFRQARPEVPADGEMQADTAVVTELMVARSPTGILNRSANVLVFPNLTAANASYKLLNRLGDAEVIGPILSGLSRAVHVLQRDAEVSDVVNLTAIAVADAQRKAHLLGDPRLQSSQV
jgi:malate dehydrogenase (oxaloacetate-decarboxylating)(NADP+)